MLNSNSSIQIALVLNQICWINSQCYSVSYFRNCGIRTYKWKLLGCTYIRCSRLNIYTIANRAAIRLYATCVYDCFHRIYHGDWNENGVALVTMRNTSDTLFLLLYYSTISFRLIIKKFNDDLHWCKCVTLM